MDQDQCIVESAFNNNQKDTKNRKNNLPIPFTYFFSLKMIFRKN